MPHAAQATAPGPTTPQRPGRALALAAMAALCAAAPENADPLVVVRRTLDGAREVVVGEGSRNEKIESLRGVASGLLDTRSMGRIAIGPILAEQAPERQREFLELFDEVVLRAYLQKLLFFDEPRFAYAEPRIDGDRALVPTRILTGVDEFFVDYEMRRRDGSWRAIDVVIEGISLIGNYRSQFASLLRTRSFDELLELMRRKRSRYRGTGAS